MVLCLIMRVRDCSTEGLGTQTEVKSTVRIPAALWKRARQATGPQQTLQRLLIEGLELRVAQLEQEGENREGNDAL